MELSAGNHDDRCGDPDCVGCRIRRGERPRPTLVDEFNALNARLQHLAEEAKAGQVKERQVSIAVSETSLIFMAWLDRLMTGRYSGGLRIVDIDRPSDFEGALRYMSHLLVTSLEREFEGFAEGRHPPAFSASDRGA